MPIFEYQCQGCGHVFEKIRVVRKDADLPRCPVCQAGDTHQLLSRFSSPSTEGSNLACAPSALS